MTDRPYRGAIDYQRLAGYFRVLSTPNRLQLLHKLQWPLTLSEIELPPFRKDRERRADRPLSRQAVKGHLDKLQGIGLVRERATRRDGQPVAEYLVNPARLFVVTDELRRLGLIRPPSEAKEGWSQSAGDGTVAGGAPVAESTMPAGPALLLVTGPMEGAALSLEGTGPWTLGRGTEADVRVPHDPFVSTRNSELRREGGRFFLRDLPASRNGTTLNWHLLDEGEEMALEPGDTIGVGRSLLALRIPTHK